MTLAVGTEDLDYRLHPEEPAGFGMRRLAIAQVEHALALVRELGADGEPDPAVHRARKDIKRARAVLRLVRSAIGEEAFRRENALLRAAGELLGGARDAQVKLTTLDAETPRLAERVPKEVLAAWREGLRKQRADQVVRLMDEGEGEVESILETGRAGICDWPIGRIDGEVLVRGFRDVHRTACARFESVLSGGDFESVHAWRRRAKDTRHHLEVFSELRADLDAGELRRAQDLSSLLGEHNDLAILAADARHADGIGKHATAIAAVLGERNAALVDEAIVHGRPLFAGEPPPLPRFAGVSA